jgi:hypothetical protein
MLDREARMHCIVSLLFLLFFGVACSSSAFAGKRVALVIGNDSYANLSAEEQLQKARNDARATKATLDKLGFDTTIELDADRLTFNRKLNDFVKRIDPGDEAAFFFAGHGVEVDGRNYLLPSNVPSIDVGEEELLKSEAIPVDHIIELMEGRDAQLSLLVIDACRNNPFKDARGRSIGGSRGLARIQDPAEGTLVLFSAGTGQRALDRLSESDPHPNSVFTRTFLPLVAQEGLELSTLTRQIKSEVRDLAKTVKHQQTPAVYNEVIGDVYLAGRGIVTEPKSPATSAPPDPGRKEWDAVASSGSIAVLEAFAARFPDTVYATFARARIEELKKQQQAALPPPAQATPEAGVAHRLKLTGKYKAVLGGGGEGDMEIRTNHDGSQYFSTEVFFENGHSCALTGTAVPVTSGWRFMDGSSCILELDSKGDGKVTLKTDNDAQCSDYCGARASLDGIAFRRSK